MVALWVSATQVSESANRNTRKKLFKPRPCSLWYSKQRLVVNTWLQKVWRKNWTGVRSDLEHENLYKMLFFTICFIFSWRNLFYKLYVIFMLCLTLYHLILLLSLLKKSGLIWFETVYKTLIATCETFIETLIKTIVNNSTLWKIFFVPTFCCAHPPCLIVM